MGEVGSECNTPACEKPKHQVSEEVEVAVKVLDNELEDEMEKVEVADIELEDNPEEVEVAELEDCPTTPNCEKVEHKIVKDLGKEASSEDSEGNEESDPEIEEVQEVGSECNTPACEKPKHQVSEEVEVAVKVL